MIGYIVRARAGMMGSGNIFTTITNDIKTPISNKIDIYRKFVKCTSENKANTPHWELWSKVVPLKKYPEKIMKINVNMLLRNNRR